MASHKVPVTMQSFLEDDVRAEVTPGHEQEKVGTGEDQHDMIRMGKKQETRVSHSR